MNNLQVYITQFQNLHTNVLKGKIAPHKPILLLAVIEAIEEGEISENQIRLTDELIKRFNQLWTKMIGDYPDFVSDVSKPYFHMDYEPFWHLQAIDPSKGKLLPSYTINWMRNHFEYASLDKELFHWLIQDETRGQLKATLISYYFTGNGLQPGRTLVANGSVFLLRKAVDWSLLHQGLTVPSEYVPLWQSLPGGVLKRGEKRPVKFILDGDVFDAELINQAFDEAKFYGHSDVYQIRYNQGSPLATKLREVFSSSYGYIENIREARGGKSKSPISVPEEAREFLMFSASIKPDVFILECETKAEKIVLQNEITQISEYDFEACNSFRQVADTTTGYTIGKALQKFRKLDRSIGDSLKQLYDFRCQMTGEYVGMDHGVHVVEAHHIDPFTTSLNNDTSNIIIISPSYHRIIHQANPVFDRKQLAFIYQNGLIDKVKINKHLLH